ncbi:MAG: DMT family transporter [Flavisolibacter sp.]|nr:DMT family transporter [Flavisolibacter sp.]
MVQKQTLTLTGFAITFTGAVLFSTKAILVKAAFAHTSVDAVTLLTLRMIFSLPFFLVTAFAVCNRTNNSYLNQKEWLLTILMGVFGYYLSSLFDFLGLQYISAGLERLILFLYPTFAVLINAVVFKQKIVVNQIIALLLTYAGIVLAYVGELLFEKHNAHFLLGSFLVFLCSITYSIYIVGSGRLIPYVGANKFTAYTMLSATAGVFLHFIIKGNYALLLQTSGLWWYGILLAVIATVVPSFLLAYGLKRIGSNNVAIISSVGPVSTIIQAHYFLGEKIFIEQILGTALVLTGVLLLGWKGGKRLSFSK